LSHMTYMTLMTSCHLVFIKQVL